MKLSLLLVVLLEPKQVVLTSSYDSHHWCLLPRQSLSLLFSAKPRGTVGLCVLCSSQLTELCRVTWSGAKNSLLPIFQAHTCNILCSSFSSSLSRPTRSSRDGPLLGMALSSYPTATHKERILYFWNEFFENRIWKLVVIYKRKEANLEA